MMMKMVTTLIKSLMVLLDCKEAMASGDGEHLALIQKQMLLYFSSVSGFNSYAFEMLNWQKQKHRN